MLVANIDVEHGFATGSTGGLERWSPEVSATQRRVKHARANVPEAQARFYHEASYQSKKRSFLSQVDFLDIVPRKEVVATAKGKPSMLQLTVQPAYCLAIHKVQALTSRHDVNGCLEGTFALGQLYVLRSRVTDPNLFRGVGLPPTDLLDDAARAWAATGLAVNRCFAATAKVSGDWAYSAPPEGVDPCLNVRARLKLVHQEEQRVKLRLFALCEILNSQPRAAGVVRALLSWIGQADIACQEHLEKPPFRRRGGYSIFPGGEEWWLADVNDRKAQSPQVDLASDIVADGDLAINLSEVGSAADDSDADGDESVAADEGLPIIPRASARLSNLVASKPCAT